MGGGPGASDVPTPATPKGASALEWKLPKGWTQSRSGGMRYASLKPPTTGRIDVSVVVLPGDAGGELANVNRWRGQIGQGPIDAAALEKSRKVMKTPAGALALYEFQSADSKSRLVAGLLTAGGNSWFLKMVGDAEAVGAAHGGFLNLLETLHFEGSQNR
jgi:hypothetical protein